MRNITNKYVQKLLSKLRNKYNTYVSISININAYKDSNIVVEYMIYINCDNIIKSDTSNNILYFKTIDELINKMEELING